MIELRAGEFALHFDSKLAASGWTRVFLSGPDGETALGADDYQVVASRLRAALGGGLEQTGGEIDGHSVSWVLSLSEEHTSFYARPDGDDLLLFLRAADASPLATLRLDSKARGAWQALL